MAEFQTPGYHSVNPYIPVAGAERFIDFTVKAFGAEEMGRFAAPDGTIMHAEVRIGDSVVMLTDASDAMSAQPTALYVYVRDVDATHQQAVAAGGTSREEPSDKFYGDRTSTIVDPFGNQWFLATHVEDVDMDEMRKRAAEQGASDS